MINIRNLRENIGRLLPAMLPAVIDIPLFSAAQLWGNILIIALLFIAGPASFVLCSMFVGEARNRAFAAFTAGIIATISVIIAAGLGAQLNNYIDMRVFRIGGAISILIISLILFGLPLPSYSTLLPLFGGIILGVIVRLFGGVM